MSEAAKDGSQGEKCTHPRRVPCTFNSMPNTTTNGTHRECSTEIIKDDPGTAHDDKSGLLESFSELQKRTRDPGCGQHVPCRRIKSQWLFYVREKEGEGGR